MIKVSGKIIIDGKERYCAVQGISKKVITKMIMSKQPNFIKSHLYNYWNNSWDKYAEHSIESEEEGMWITEGLENKHKLNYRRIA